jgi:trimeric autotransporter adhesin
MHLIKATATFALIVSSLLWLGSAHQSIAQETAVGPPMVITSSHRMINPKPKMHRPFFTPCSGVGQYAFLGQGVGDQPSGLASATVAGSYNEACAGYSGVMVGSNNNICSAGTGTAAEWSFIGGGNSSLIDCGADNGFIGAGAANTLSGEWGAIVAGNGNQVLGSGGAIVSGIGNYGAGLGSFIGAGASNTVGAGGEWATIGGGLTNTIGATPTSSAYASTIAGGKDNVVNAQLAAVTGGDGNKSLADLTFVGGGMQNQITPINGSITEQYGALYAVVGGGFQNLVEALATNGAAYGFIGGGSTNVVNGEYASVAGGLKNTASGTYSSVPGGTGNIASGSGSFAAGTRSVARNTGAFVWSDAAMGATPLKSSMPDQFLVRATGGTIFFTDPTLTTGVQLASGSGTWASLSDRAEKADIEPADNQLILARVASLPIDIWRYLGERAGVHHIGPMAQDFYASFGVGPDDRHITEIDSAGVALAAIKGLYERTTEENLQLRSQLAAENNRIQKLSNEVNTLVAALRPRLSVELRTRPVTKPNN